MRLHDEVIERWRALQQASEEEGYPASHCDGGTCVAEAPALCICNCEGCARAVLFLDRAEREVLSGEGRREGSVLHESEAPART